MPAYWCSPMTISSRNNMASGSGNAGILLQKCSNNTVFGNVVQGNGNEGLLLENASFNRLEKNEVSDNRYGCKLVGSRENVILGNTFLQNRFDAINLAGKQRQSHRWKLCSRKRQCTGFG